MVRLAILVLLALAGSGCQAIQNDPLLGGNPPPMVMDGAKTR